MGDALAGRRVEGPGLQILSWVGLPTGDGATQPIAKRKLHLTATAGPLVCGEPTAPSERERACPSSHGS